MIADNSNDVTILICGSFYFMGDAKRAIQTLGEGGDQDCEEIMASNVVSPVETSINNTSLPLT